MVANWQKDDPLRAEIEEKQLIGFTADGREIRGTLTNGLVLGKHHYLYTCWPGEAK